MSVEEGSFRDVSPSSQPINLSNSYTTSHLDVIRRDSSLPVSKHPDGDFSKTAGFKALSPILTSLRLTGIYFVKDFRERKKQSALSIISRIYSTIVLVMMAAIFVKGFTMYNDSESFGAYLFSKLCTHIYYLEVFGNIAIMHSVSLRCNSLPRFFTKWHRIQSLKLPTCQNLTALHRKVKIWTVLAWVVAVIDCSIENGTFFTTELWDDILAPFDTDGPYVIYIKSVLAIFITYAVFCWVLVPVFVYSLSMAIGSEFDVSNSELERVNQDGVLSVSILRARRMVQQELCELAIELDNIVNVYVGLKFATTLGMICLMAYMIIYYPEARSSAFIVILLLIWVGIAASLMCLLLIGASAMNQKAHAAFNILHRLDLRGASQEVALEVTMFLSRLTGQPIGLTALNMFVVNKPTILTMFGMLITYFVLLLEFRPDDDVTIAQNCTMQ